MPSVLIVDPIKSSVVMTSEIFKDKVPGIVVRIAKTGELALEMLSSQHFDIIIVDFDLPDADGVTFAKIARKSFKGPILLTAFPEPVVEDAIKTEMFGYDDLASWIKKPLEADNLAKKIDKFLVKKQRIGKRYLTDIQTELVKKSSSKTQVKGRILNLSLGGALIKWEKPCKINMGDEIAINCELSSLSPKPKKSTPKTSAKSIPSKKDSPKDKVKLKGLVAWANKDKIGIRFSELSENQHQEIEKVLRKSKELL